MAESSPPGNAATLQSFLRMVRRRLWLIALCAVLVPSSVVAYSLSQEEQYRATASLLFGDSGPTDLFGAASVLSENQEDERTAATNLSLAGLEVVAALAARRLGAAAGDVSRRVEVEPVASSNLTRINVTDTSPVAATRLANAYAEEFIELRRRAAVRDVRRVQRAVQGRLRSIQRRLVVLRGEHSSRLRSSRAAERRALTGEREKLFQRQGELRSLPSLVTGNVQLAQAAAMPDAPSSPRTRRNGAIGLGLGLVLGMALALLFEMLDRRLRDPAEVSDLIDLPILGAIPNSRALAHPPSISGLPVAETHAFHMLRTSLRYYNEDRELGSLVVTSAGPREGKTTVAWNLAAVSAQAGQKVLLLEADLRRSSLASRCRVSAALGVTDVLNGNARRDQAVNEVVVGSQVNGWTMPCTVDLIVAGAIRGDVTGLIESERMDTLIREAQEHYDLVVIDTPSTSVVPDAIPLMAKVSGVLVVTRLGRTTREAARFLNSQLSHIRAPALGVVVNSIIRQDGYYGYARERAPKAPATSESIAHR
jgi:capsular exopolysaccharide synthesis family protein